MGKLNFAGSAICSPAVGQAFAECESFPSNWASFRRGTNRSPAAGQTFVALSRKNYQSVFTSNE